MTQKLTFTKMQGLGNDFVVVEARHAPHTDWTTLARAMCDRHFGIGADQLLLITESDVADIGMRLFNTDGFEAEMCGNGVRCIGKYAYERGIVTKQEFSLETLGGIKRVQLCVEDGLVTGATVAMGVPQVSRAEVLAELSAGGAGENQLALTVVDIGNPHAVAFLDSSVDEFALERIGPLVERHTIFPERTNFEIVNIVSRDELRMRVWERSAGITLACGTGACAAVAAARRMGLVAKDVQAHLPGGTLQIQWDGDGEIYMSGPAATVFEGMWCPS